MILLVQDNHHISIKRSKFNYFSELSILLMIVLIRCLPMALLHMEIVTSTHIWSTNANRVLVYILYKIVSPIQCTVVPFRTRITSLEDQNKKKNGKIYKNLVGHTSWTCQHNLSKINMQDTGIWLVTTALWRHQCFWQKFHAKARGPWNPTLGQLQTTIR